MAIRSAFLLGAESVIAIDDVPSRLRLAAEAGAQTLNFDDYDIFEKVRAMTGGRGPDACIDAVGLEAHGTTLDAYYDKVKTSAMLGTDRPVALRQAIHACRKPVIAAINGAAVGIGATMTLAMDARLVSTSARFGLVFGRIGIVGGHLDNALNAAFVLSAFGAAVACIAGGRGAVAT